MRMFLCFIALLCLCSCSVKENRSECPCDLLVHLSEALKTDGSVLVSVIQEDVVVKQGMMSREDFEAGSCVLTVPRRPSRVTVFTGITDMNAISGRRLDIRYDHQCDELYSSSDFADLQGDTFDCAVLPHKNYARLFLTLLGLPEGGEVTLSGNVQGYDLMSLDPCKGVFQCTPGQDVVLSDYLVRIPRQVDNALRLDAFLDGNMFRSVPVGAMIEATGYRYDDEDLLDIYLTVDLTKSFVLVTVSGWETETYPIIEY